MLWSCGFCFRVELWLLLVRLSEVGGELLAGCSSLCMHLLGVCTCRVCTPIVCAYPGGR